MSKLLLGDTTVANFGDAKLGQQGQNGFSDEIKFQIVTNGGVNPTVKFVDVASSGTGSSPMLSAGRDRTQDIIITMGPLASDKKGDPTQLIVSAQNLFLAQEVQVGR